MEQVTARVQSPADISPVQHCLKFQLLVIKASLLYIEPASYFYSQMSLPAGSTGPASTELHFFSWAGTNLKSLVSHLSP